MLYRSEVVLPDPTASDMLELDSPLTFWNKEMSKISEVYAESIIA